MFRHNWLSSGEQVVMVKDYAAQYNVILFPHIVKEYEKRTVEEVAHRRYESFKVRSLQCNRMLKYSHLYLSYGEDISIDTVHN
jgi:hypothetical protein